MFWVSKINLRFVHGIVLRTDHLYLPCFSLSLSLFLTVDNKGGVKISDFGISKKVEEGNDCLKLAV